MKRIWRVVVRENGELDERHFIVNRQNKDQAIEEIKRYCLESNLDYIGTHYIDLCIELPIEFNAVAKRDTSEFAKKASEQI